MNDIALQKFGEVPGSQGFSDKPKKPNGLFSSVLGFVGSLHRARKASARYAELSARANGLEKHEIVRKVYNEFYN